MGSLGLSGEGWFDGWSLMQAFRRKARSRGARYVDAEATGFALDGERIVALTLADGSRIDGDVFVNAAGPWAARVAAWARRRPAGARAAAPGVRVRMPDRDAALPARHRPVGTVVSPGGRRLPLRPVAGRVERSRRCAARRRPRRLRRRAVAAPRRARAGVRGGPRHRRVGRLLRDQHRRPQRHRRRGDGCREPATSPTASRATACSRRRRSGAASPSSSCTAATARSTCRRSRSTGSSGTGRSSS